MTIGATAYTTIPALPASIYDRLTLERALPLLVHAIPAQKKPIPQKNSKTITFTKYPSLPKGVELAPGVNPEPYQLSRTTKTGTLKWYGAYVQIDEEVNLTVQDPVLSETAELLGENAGETFDDVYANAYQATTSIIWASDDHTTIATQDTSDVALAVDFVAMFLTLRNANAKPFFEMIRPSDGVSTMGIGASYLGITSYSGASAIITVVKAVTNGSLTFVPVAQYPDVSSVLEGEIGAIVGNLASLRIVCSTAAKVYTGQGASSIDVHSLMIFGKNAVAVSELSGYAIQNIVKPASVIGGPLEMYCTSGWKGAQCVTILDDTFMQNYIYTLGS